MRVRLRERDPLEWNPAVTGSVRFETYARVLNEAVTGMIHSALGAGAMREIAYDIALGDLGTVAVAGLRAATTGLPGLTATPGRTGVCRERPTARPAGAANR
ncbi:MULTISPECIES: hypothetical protein [unclassified Spirillospora]|uniref:hypothetical protein n=1 Tax=unclassified Spirillospora TaxID=2642701 RepID=UPI0037169AC9